MINTTNRYSTSTHATLRLTFHCLLTGLATTPYLVFVFFNCLSLHLSSHTTQYVAYTEILDHDFHIRGKAGRSQRGSQCLEDCAARKILGQAKIRET